MKLMLWEDSFQALELRGKGTLKFLQGQTSVDILNSKKNIPIKACWLSTSGKVRAILEILLTNDSAKICVIRGDSKEIYEGFNKVIFPSDEVEINPIKQIRRVQIMDYKISWKESQVVWLNDEEGLPEAFSNFIVGTTEDFQKWSISQGLPFSNNEVKGDYSPLELGLYDLLDTKKGCYLGQESVARSLRFDLNKKLVFWESKEIVKTGEKFILASSSEDIKDQNIVGLVTSYICLKNSHSIGLAIVKKKYLVNNNFLCKSNFSRLLIKDTIGFKESIEKNNN